MWSPMKAGCGCEGRYTPASAAPDPEPSAAMAAALAWGDVPKEPVTYESWLRERISAVAETEINVQLGELTLKRHHMQLLEQAVARHEDFVATFGAHAASTRYQCAEVKRSRNRRWMRLLGLQHDVQIWSPDDRAPNPPRAALISGMLSSWLQPALETLRTSVPLLSAGELSLVDVQVRAAVRY